MAEEIITNEVIEIDAPTGASESESNNTDVALLEAEIKKLKAQVSRANTEAAENKRKYQATLTEQERLANEKAEADAKILEELESYKVRERVSNYTSKLLANGYDEDTAKKMAVSLPEGIDDSFFLAQKSFIENKFAAYKAELLNAQSQISTGAPVQNSITKEEFAKMDYSALTKLKTEDPELYENLKK